MNIVLYFFIFSFLGWIIESVWASFKFKKLVSKQVMLKSPLCPVYGFGAVGLYLLLYPFRNSYLLLFSLGFFVASLTEYLYALYYEKRYGVTWWDYRNNKGNLDGKVCVGFSLLWGAMTILFFKFLFPIAQKAVLQMGAWQKLFMSVFLVFYFLNDSRATSEEIKKIAQGGANYETNKFKNLRKL